MRTLLSHEDTARKSGELGAGEKARSEMLSEGGSLRATSLLRSPVVVAAGVELVLPKSPDIVVVICCCGSEEEEGKRERFWLAFGILRFRFRQSGKRQGWISAARRGMGGVGARQIEKTCVDCGMAVWQTRTDTDGDFP